MLACGILYPNDRKKYVPVEDFKMPLKYILPYFLRVYINKFKFLLIYGKSIIDNARKIFYTKNVT